ncbi:MAG: hypothetical protein IJ685_06885 [Selenomonadaceae bacterium]|nr:hypothetical protein [Selenomonadaceae bacterium]
MLIFRRATNDFIVDVLEPHCANDTDNLSKAKALARFAQENPIVGRAEMIRGEKIFSGDWT